MAVKGNYTRKHWLAPYTAEGGAPEAAAETWLRFGNRISSITDDSSDETEANVYYDSEDGNPEEILLSRQEVWTFEGQYDATDKAHELVAKARRSDDEGRKVWHKIEEADGSIVIGLAKIFDPIAGGGEAASKETLSGRLAFIKKPTITPVAP